MPAIEVGMRFKETITGELFWVSEIRGTDVVVRWETGEVVHSISHLRNLLSNGFDILPERTAEDEARELLMEFAERWNGQPFSNIQNAVEPVITEEAITDFLTQKFRKDGTV